MSFKLDLVPNLIISNYSIRELPLKEVCNNLIKAWLQIMNGGVSPAPSCAKLILYTDVSF